MTSLTEEEEAILDNNTEIKITRGETTYDIKPNEVYCYGIIDFTSGSDDMDIISDFNWFNHLKLQGISVPSNYDYKNHCAYSDLNYFRYYDTMRPDIVAQYGHGCINKPERTIIFKRITKAKPRI